MTHPRKSTGWKVFGGIVIVVGALLAVCSILFFIAFGTGERGEVRTVWQGCLAGVTAVIFGTGIFAAKPGPGARASQPGAARVPGARPSPGNAALEGMISHSEDVVATLRDIVAHGGDGFGDLPDLLRRTGLMDWPEAPATRAHRLHRSGRWWLGATMDDEMTYDGIVALEVALNLNDDLMGRPCPPGATLEERAQSVLAGVHRLRPRTFEADDPAAQLLEFLTDETDERGEWSCRTRCADAFENLPLPVRAGLAFRANVARGLLCARLTVPYPTCLSAVSSDEPARERILTGYAARAALAVARAAFASSPALTRVVVSCGHGTGETLVSLDLDAEALERLDRLMGTDVEDLPSDPALRARGCEGSASEPLKPHLTLDDERLCPPERYQEVELDVSPVGEPLATACGARRAADLGIMEKAGRTHAWRELVPRLGNTTQGAVALLVDLRDRTDDVTVAEACERTSRALVAGTTDVSATDELERLFVDGGDLVAVTDRARAALGQECPPERLEELLAELEAALSPITSMGIYLDDTASVYRYFNSFPERIRYNLAFRDDGRTVRLVPDEYYAAHSLAARMLNLLGRPGEALSHAEELMRIAPLTPDAALMKVRVLEDQSRIFEAADLLKETIGYASMVRDLAICFYRLAFMEWKLGREDLTVICYQRAINLHPEVAKLAQEELDDLLSANSELKPLPDDEIVEALSQAGLPTGEVSKMRRQTRDALVATTDAGVFSVAHALAGSLHELISDDALLDVRRSLTRP